MQCLVCKYWVNLQHYKKGECRRHAPIINHDTLATNSPQYSRDQKIDTRRYPMVEEDEWCGDYELR